MSALHLPPDHPVGTTPVDLRAQALAAIRRYELLRGGDVVLVAVSGGPDSVALLDVLVQLAPDLGLCIAAAHVDHELRAESGADAELARALADRLGVPFHLERVRVRREPPWEGLEAEARRARHAALEGRARAIGATRIATGHTADDQAETVLMRLLAGAGPRGLAGIAPLRGPYVRPLIDSRRADVMAHLAARGLDWVEDASNRDLRFLRNRIRHEVLPSLAKVHGPSVIGSLCRSAALCRALADDLERRGRDAAEHLGAKGACGIVFPIADLQGLDAELAAEIVFQAAVSLGETRPRRGAAHRAVRRLVAATSPRRGVGMGRLVIERSGRWLRVGPPAVPALRPRRWQVPGALALEEIGLRLEARRFDRPANYTPPRERHCAAFDADGLADSLVVRARRRGDRFPAFGSPAERRVKAFLIDEGVPRWERPRVPVLESRGEIVWVVGLRRGRGALISRETKRILEVTVLPL